MSNINSANNSNDKEYNAKINGAEIDISFF